MVCLNSMRVMRLEYVIAVGSGPVARCRLIVTHLPSRSENLPDQAVPGLNVSMRFARIAGAKYGLNWVGLLGRMR